MNRQQDYDDESDEEDSDELIDNGAHDNIEEDDDIEELGTQFNEQFVNQQAHPSHSNHQHQRSGNQTQA